jgi:uncharacterized protein (TIGR02271 family)
MHNERLVPLESLPDFHVADGYTDIRGFDAFTADGRQVGRVDHLLVDPDAQRVAAITLEGGMSASGRDMQVPIEDVEIDTPTRRVLIQGAGAQMLGMGTAGAAGAAAMDMDTASHRRTGTAGEERLTLAEERLDVHKEQVSAGALEVNKHVETQHVREQVPLRHEEVTVERRPITDPTANPEARFEGDEIRIPLMEEEVVVEKRQVAKEELVITKGQVQESQTVEADLRRERAVIHEHGDVQRGTVHGDADGLRADNPLKGGRDLDGDGVR